MLGDALNKDLLNFYSKLSIVFNFKYIFQKKYPGALLTNCQLLYFSLQKLIRLSLEGLGIKVGF